MSLRNFYTGAFMPQLQPLENRICTTPIKLSRHQLRLLPKLNPRKNYGNLSRLGASLDTCRQTTPLAVVDIPGEPEVFGVREGSRRVVAVDQGYAPRFAELDEWDCVVLRTPEGGIPREREIRRWCAATNMARKNWLPIERALFYRQEIEEAIQDRINEINSALPQQAHIDELEPKEVKKITREVKKALAAMEGRRCDQTITNHLMLLELPVCVQEQLFKGNISQDAALRFRAMKEGHANAILKAVAKQDRIDLNASQIPGDVFAPTEVEEVEDVFMSEDAPWFVPAKLEKEDKRLAKGPRTIRAKAVEEVKALKGFEGYKSRRQNMRSVGEVQEELDRLDKSGNDTLEAQIKRQVLRWTLNQIKSLPQG